MHIYVLLVSFPFLFFRFSAEELFRVTRYAKLQGKSDNEGVESKKKKKKGERAQRLLMMIILSILLLPISCHAMPCTTVFFFFFFFG